MNDDRAARPEYPALDEAVQALPSPQRIEEMVETNLKYAQCFLDGDFDGMEEFLVETPVFEQYPQAVRITGRDAARARAERHYRDMIEQLDPRKGENTHEISVVAFGADVMIHEFSSEFELSDGTSRRCRMLAIVAFEDDKMIGERVFTDHYLAEMDSSHPDEGFYGRADVTDLGGLED